MPPKTSNTLLPGQQTLNSFFGGSPRASGPSTSAAVTSSSGNPAPSTNAGGPKATGSTSSKIDAKGKGKMVERQAQSGSVSRVNPMGSGGLVGTASKYSSYSLIFNINDNEAPASFRDTPAFSFDLDDTLTTSDMEHLWDLDAREVVQQANGGNWSLDLASNRLVDRFLGVRTLATLRGLHYYYADKYWHTGLLPILNEHLHSDPLQLLRLANNAAPPAAATAPFLLALGMGRRPNPIDIDNLPVITRATHGPGSAGIYADLFKRSETLGRQTSALVGGGILFKRPGDVPAPTWEDVNRLFKYIGSHTGQKGLFERTEKQHADWGASLRTMEKKISAVTNNSKLPSATGTSANFGPALSAHYLLAHGDARYPHPTPPIRPTTSPLYTPLDWATPSTIITPPSYPTLPQRRFSSLRHTDKYGKEDEGAIMFAESFSNLLSVSAMGPHHLGRVESVFGGDNVVSKWMEQDEVVGAGRLHGGEGRLSGGKGPKDAEQQKAAARMGGLAGGLARWEAEHPEESRAGKSKGGFAASAVKREKTVDALLKGTRYTKITAKGKTSNAYFKIAFEGAEARFLIDKKKDVPSLFTVIGLELPEPTSAVPEPFKFTIKFYTSEKGAAAMDESRRLPYIWVFESGVGAVGTKAKSHNRFTLGSHDGGVKVAKYVREAQAREREEEEALDEQAVEEDMEKLRQKGRRARMDLSVWGAPRAPAVMKGKGKVEAEEEDEEDRDDAAGELESDFEPEVQVTLLDIALSQAFADAQLGGDE